MKSLNKIILKATLALWTAVGFCPLGIGQTANPSPTEKWRRGANVQPPTLGQIDEFTFQLKKSDLVRINNSNLAMQPNLRSIKDWPKPIDKRDFRKLDRSAKFSASQIYVAFKPGTRTENVLAANQTMRANVKWTCELVPLTYKVAVPTGSDIESVINQYLDMPEVLYAEPCYVQETYTIPNDTYWQTEPSNCWCDHRQPLELCTWGMRDNFNIYGGIRAPVAWDETVGDPNFVIAVIDTGTAISHDDLAANIWFNPSPSPAAPYFGQDINGWNVAENNGDVAPCGVEDAARHGSHTAGTVGAVGNNGIGVAGVNWHCKLMILRAATDWTDPSDGTFYPCGSFLFNTNEAVDYAISRGAKISNNSYGGSTFSQTSYNTILAGQSMGHLFVTSAGNDGRDIDATPQYPAAYDLSNIVTVGSIAPGGSRSSFSNFGVSAVDVGAPGNQIMSCSVTDYYNSDGTSMSAPHVAGSAALVWGRNPSLSWWHVKQRVCEGTPLRTFTTICQADLCRDFCCNEYPGTYCWTRVPPPLDLPCRFGAQLDLWKSMGYWFGNTIIDPTRPIGSYRNRIDPAIFSSALQQPLFSTFATANIEPGTTISIGGRIAQPISIRAPDGGTVRLVP